MENSFEIDFDEWELLSDTRHNFFEFGFESERDLLFSEDIDTNYFSNDRNLIIEEKVQQIVQKDIITVLPSQTPPTVVFKKIIKEDEFVDMKVESPKTNTTGIINMPPIESEKILFNSEDEYDEDEFYKYAKNLEKGIEIVEPTRKEKQNWRWRVIGGAVALCSVCIFILGGRQLQRHHHQRIQFQIYTNEKRVKQVVQQATRLNQAFSAMRGVPIARAHVSFGGYYDGL